MILNKDSLSLVDCWTVSNFRFNVDYAYKQHCHISHAKSTVKILEPVDIVVLLSQVEFSWVLRRVDKKSYFARKKKKSLMCNYIDWSV